MPKNYLDKIKLTNKKVYILGGCGLIGSKVVTNTLSVSFAIFPFSNIFISTFPSVSSLTIITITFNTLSKPNIANSNSYLPFELTSKLFNFSNNDISSRYKLIEDVNDNHVAKSLLNQRAFLDKWLQRQDRAGMFASVEIRVPYCNVELFKNINSVSFEEKTENGKVSKFLLKKIAENYLPNEIVYRKKIGFSIPLEDWFRDKKGFGLLLSYLEDDTFKSRSFYNHKFISYLIKNHLSKKGNYGRVLWTLINIELWHRIFIDQSLVVNKF